MHERLNSYAEFLDQPHVRETGLIQWLAQAGLTGRCRSRCPACAPGRPHAARNGAGTGQHTKEILAEHGFGAAEIDGPAGPRDGRQPPQAAPDHAARSRQYHHAVEERRRRHRRIASTAKSGASAARRSPGRAVLRLPGFDRLQVLVAGSGLVLQTPYGEIDVRRPLRPVRFAGETPIVSRLEAGPVEVVNLIGDRAMVRIDLGVLEAGSTRRLELGHAHCLCPAGRRRAPPGRRDTHRPCKPTWPRGSRVDGSRSATLA